MKYRLLFALILMGFTSLLAQSLFIREFLVSFYGNELTIGIILANWIILEAAGSALLARFATKAKRPLAVYSLLQLLISIYLPLGIFFSRIVKNFLPITTGEAVGLIPIFSLSLFIIAPLSIFDGAQFPFGLRLYANYSKKPLEATGKVYILEAVGFIIGGIVFTYVFLTRLNSFWIALIVGLINLISGLLLIEKEKPSWFRKIIKLSLWGAALIWLSAAVYNLPTKIHQVSLQKQWKAYQVLDYRNSIYGNLMVTKAAEQITFYSNGLPIINLPMPDIIFNEEFIHFGMLACGNPKEILIVGGGAGGGISEILKYPIKKVDYAQLDPLLIKILKEFPTELTEKELRAPSLNLKIIDGARYIKSTCSFYDVIFVNLPSPSTLQLNRYYTKEFFNCAKKILKKNGILVFSLPGSLSYLSQELIALNLSILDTLKETFSEARVVPGDFNLYLASGEPLDISANTFIKRLSSRHIPVRFLTDFHIQNRLQPSWQDWFLETLKQAPQNIRENKNLLPSGLFYELAYWNSLFSPYLRGLFKFLDKLSLQLVATAILFLTLLIFFIHKRTVQLRNIGIASAIATTGFVGMSLNLIFIMSYQSFFGFVYHHIAVLMTSFMAGLALGGWLMTRNLERIGNSKKLISNADIRKSNADKRRFTFEYICDHLRVICANLRSKKEIYYFAGIEILIILFSAMAGFLLVYLGNLQNFLFYPLFFILSAISGFLVALEFPLANKIYQEKANLSGAGILYALDLVGAFFAALVVSVYLLPVLGVIKTCLLLVVLKICSLSLVLSTNTIAKPKPRG